LAKDELSKGGILLKALFGDKSKGRNAAITDSRQISPLAAAFASPEKVRLLAKGHSLSQVHILTQPIEERLTEGLEEVRDTLRDLISRVSEENLKEDVATQLLNLSSGTRKLAAELDRKIKESAFGTVDSDD